MTNNKFSSMQELTTYLSVLENRILSLEKDNRDLKDAVNEVSNEILINRRRSSSRLPQTKLLNTSFLSRAFAVWGHFFVANLFVSIVFSVIYFFIVIVLLGNLVSNFP